MSKLVWGQIDQNLYETGVEKGVLYPQAEDGTYPKGVAWPGLINVSESPSGAEPTALWADNKKYLNLMSTEEFGATVECYAYPPEFKKCDGSVEIAPGVFASQQDRQQFGMSYKTLIGNGAKGTSYGYKLHLIYGALASPSEKGYNTVNDSPEAITFSYELSTTPVEIPGFKPTAQITIESTSIAADKLALLEDALYGTTDKEAYLPLPEEIISIVGEVAAVG